MTDNIRYIKDLAERLQHLEGVVHTGEPSSVQYPPNDNTAPLRRASEDLSSPPNHDGGSKKRTYSSISRDDLTSSTFLQRVTGYPLTHGSPQHSFSQLPINYSVSQITPNVLANSSNLSDHLAPLSESRMAPETRRLSIPSETPQNHNSELSISSESAVQRYGALLIDLDAILTGQILRGYSSDFSYTAFFSDKTRRESATLL